MSDERCPVCGVPRGKTWGVEPCRVTSGSSTEIIAAVKRRHQVLDSIH